MVSSLTASRGQVTNLPSSCLSKVQQPEIVRVSDAALAPQLPLKPVEGREDKTRRLGVLSKQDTGNRHHFATRSGAHASNYQRDTEEGNRCKLTLSVAKDR